MKQILDNEKAILAEIYAAAKKVKAALVEVRLIQKERQRTERKAR